MVSLGLVTVSKEREVHTQTAELSVLLIQIRITTLV